MGRLLNIVISLIGLILLSPVLSVVALFVKMHDGGPVTYRAKRVGIRGAIFDLHKFRTMVPNANKMGGGITVLGDKRVTPIGRFLRKYKLDELPQLFNVLKGDMSFVGPRPEDPRYVERYTPEQREVLSVPPGITSPASLHFRNEEALLSGGDWESKYIEQILPRKLAMELEYFPSRSLGGDVRIIIRTLGGILK
ncbi:MAG TPA: sugar transferase [Bacteroidota bacterium]|nr:sugar transferase [Bacteroidota bacterium]HLE32988.1 sugar transferase [Bacteroidota bacterium]